MPVPPFTVSPVVRVALVTAPAVRPEAVPVIFVPTNVVGVPKFGVMKTGEVASANTVPLQVVVISPSVPALSYKTRPPVPLEIVVVPIASVPLPVPQSPVPVIEITPELSTCKH